MSEGTFSHTAAQMVHWVEVLWLSQPKEENDHRKYFMINLCERMLRDSAGITIQTCVRLKQWPASDGLWGMDTLSDKKRLVKLLLHPFENVIYTENKELVQKAANSFLLEYWLVE